MASWLWQSPEVSRNHAPFGQSKQTGSIFGFIPHKPLTWAWSAAKQSVATLASRASVVIPAVPWAVTRKITRAVGALATTLTAASGAIAHMVQEVAQKVKPQIPDKVDRPPDTASDVISVTSQDVEPNERADGYQRLSTNERLAVDEYQRVTTLCEQKGMLYGRIISIQCFQEERHEFIIVHSKGFFFRDDPRQHAWIRIERWTDKPEEADWKDKVKMAFRPKTYNRFKVSFDERSLVPLNASPRETLEFQDFVGLEHLITLLELVEKAPLDYSLLKDHSWFFCMAIVDCMDIYQPKPINLRRFFIGQDRRLELKKSFHEAIGKKLRSYDRSSHSPTQSLSL